MPTLETDTFKDPCVSQLLEWLGKPGDAQTDLFLRLARYIGRLPLWAAMFG